MKRSIAYSIKARALDYSFPFYRHLFHFDISFFSLSFLSPRLVMLASQLAAAFAHSQMSSQSGPGGSKRSRGILASANALIDSNRAAALKSTDGAKKKKRALSSNKENIHVNQTPYDINRFSSSRGAQRQALQSNVREEGENELSRTRLFSTMDSFSSGGVGYCNRRCSYSPLARRSRPSSC
jgi:hypothetical protein